MVVEVVVAVHLLEPVEVEEVHPYRLSLAYHTLLEVVVVVVVVVASSSCLLLHIPWAFQPYPYHILLLVEVACRLLLHQILYVV
jgi:hypothetical protein